MKFENWEKLKSVILRYEEKIKESKNDKEFSEINDKSDINIIIDKKNGSIFNSKSSSLQLIKIINKEYITFKNSIDGKTEKEPIDENSLIKTKNFNFIINDNDTKIISCINLFKRFKDSLFLIKVTELNNEQIKLYGTGIENKSFLQFLITNDNKIRGMIFNFNGSNSSLNTFFTEYTEIDDIVIPKIILVYSKGFDTMWKLLDFTTNITIKKNNFY